MKEKRELAIRTAMILILSIVLCFCLLVGSYLIPTEKIRSNVLRSEEQLQSENGYFQWLKGYKNAQMDTYTDASLLLNAMYPGSGSAIRDAMNAPRLLYGDDNNEESVLLLARGEEGETTEVQYGRYWHGSLIFLKAFLYFFDLTDLRMFTMMLQMGLLFLVIMQLTKRGKERALPGLLSGILFINPITMVMCFCFSVEYTLMLFFVYMLLKKHEWLQEGNRYLYYFLINGIVFVYFNELSFPMIGFAFPMISYLLLSEETVIQKTKKEICFGCFWVIGYAGAWIGKWVLAYLFTGYNYFMEAVGQAQRYTSAHATWEVENPTVFDRLYKNLHVYMKWPYFCLLLLLVVIVFGQLIRYRRLEKQRAMQMLPYLLMMLFPIGIFVALGNGYSYVHYWFTHRLLAISVFAGICMLYELIPQKLEIKS